MKKVKSLQSSQVNPETEQLSMVVLYDSRRRRRRSRDQSNREKRGAEGKERRKRGRKSSERCESGGNQVVLGLGITISAHILRHRSKIQDILWHLKDTNQSKAGEI